MVLESLEEPSSAEKHPRHLFWFGLMYSSIAIIISLWVFKEQSSLVMIFLTVLAISPLMYKTIKYEEQKDMEDFSEKALLKEHARALSFFMYFFFGAALSFAIWFVFLPGPISQKVFSTQISTILEINGGVTGFSVSAIDLFAKIFFNNLRVLVFSILFSFLYGIGAIFILTWNASVIGTAMGNFVRVNIASISSVAGAGTVFNYFKIFSLSIFRYAIHGVPEILAYFVAGLAGGIISVAAINHDFRTKNFEKIVLDSSDLVIISVALLFLAALLEVFVTPIFF